MKTLVRDLPEQSSKALCLTHVDLQLSDLHMALRGQTDLFRPATEDERELLEMVSNNLETAFSQLVELQR